LLSAIHCPTLVLVGKQDVITPPDINRAMQQSIPGAELAVIREAGHLSSMEQPGPFNAALGGFLANRVIM
jgi:pimeloyl-ACP methyl ester carboxylesterase